MALSLFAPTGNSVVSGRNTLPIVENSFNFEDSSTDDNNSRLPSLFSQATVLPMIPTSILSQYPMLEGIENSKKRLLFSSKTYSRLLQLYRQMGSVNGRELRQKELLGLPFSMEMLLTKSHTDEDIERLDEVSSVLVPLVQANTSEFFITLSCHLSIINTTSAFIEAMLRVIRWVTESLSADNRKQLFEFLVRLAQHDDADVRQSVVDTAICFSSKESNQLLDSIEKHEADEDVLEAIKESRITEIR